MGMDLQSDNGESFRFSGSGWSFYLTLAEEYGWRPLGSVPPAGYSQPEPWSGKYDSCDGQSVTAADAHSLADALQRALADPMRSERALRVAESLTRAVRAATDSSTYEMRNDGDDTLYMQQMIEFFRRGRFHIW
jgi:hypothetical protein